VLVLLTLAEEEKMSADMTIIAYKKLRQRELDAAWDRKWPDGMFYVIVMKDGGVVKGRMVRRSTSSHSYCDERGSTAAGFSGYYFGKSFAPWRVRSHKVYKTREEWNAALAALSGHTEGV
jgi:hypothetical protein